MDLVMSNLFPIAIAVFGLIICFVIGKAIFPKANPDQEKDNTS
jgi:hypothetical protein